MPPAPFPCLAVSTRPRSKCYPSPIAVVPGRNLTAPCCGPGLSPHVPSCAQRRRLRFSVSAPSPPAEVPIEPEERLQRVLAARGVGSRRRAESLIVAGRVAIGGRIVTELGTKIDPRAVDVRVDGKLLRAQPLRYVLLNKPTGYITTTSDERGRRTVMDLVPTRERIYPVGRLDRDTEGLLLLTNDGDVANRIMHPRYALAKEYHVLTPARPSDEAMQRIRGGVTIEGRRVIPDEFRLVRETREGPLLTIVIHEGMFHVVRRMMDAVGIPVAALRRIRLGPLSINGISVGSWRELTPGERSTLYEALRLDREGTGPSFARPANAPLRPSRSAPPYSRRSPLLEAPPPRRATEAATKVTAEGRPSTPARPPEIGTPGGTPTSRETRKKGRSPERRRGKTTSTIKQSKGQDAPSQRPAHRVTGNDDRRTRDPRHHSSTKSAQGNPNASDRPSPPPHDPSSPRRKRRGAPEDASVDRRGRRARRRADDRGPGRTTEARRDEGSGGKRENRAGGRPPAPSRRVDRKDRRDGGPPTPERDGGDEGEQRDAAGERTRP